MVTWPWTKKLSIPTNGKGKGNGPSCFCMAKFVTTVIPLSCLNVKKSYDSIGHGKFVVTHIQLFSDSGQNCTSAVEKPYLTLLCMCKTSNKILLNIRSIQFWLHKKILCNHYYYKVKWGRTRVAWSVHCCSKEEYVFCERSMDNAHGSHKTSSIDEDPLQLRCWQNVSWVLCTQLSVHVLVRFLHIKWSSSTCKQRWKQ